MNTPTELPRGSEWRAGYPKLRVLPSGEILELFLRPCRCGPCRADTGNGICGLCGAAVLQPKAREK